MSAGGPAPRRGRAGAPAATWWAKRQAWGRTANGPFGLDQPSARSSPSTYSIAKTMSLAPKPCGGERGGRVRCLSLANGPASFALEPARAIPGPFDDRLPPPITLRPRPGPKEPVVGAEVNDPPIPPRPSLLLDLISVVASPCREGVRSGGKRRSEIPGNSNVPPASGAAGRRTRRGGWARGAGPRKLSAVIAAARSAGSRGNPQCVD